MTAMDYVVLMAYIIGVFAIGGFFGSKVKSSKDMFAAGGQSPWWTSGLSAFMTMFSANTFVVWGGIAFAAAGVFWWLADLASSNRPV